MRTKQCVTCRQEKPATAFTGIGDHGKPARSCDECRNATTRVCDKCGIEKPIEQFWLERGGHRRRSCIQCRNQGHYQRQREPSLTYMAKWYRGKKDDEAFQENRRAKRVARKRAFKDAVFAKYGDACSCCNEKRRPFLTLDHINGGGKADRAEWRNGSYLWWRRLANESPRPDLYRLLCWNCNSGRELNGGICPHEEERRLLDGRVLIPAQEKD